MDFPQPGDVSRAQELCRGFGPTLASEYLARQHGLLIGREALRQLMISKPAYGAASFRRSKPFTNGGAIIREYLSV
jgi:hypothetical protein